jgi:hypothetical protein
LDLALVDVLFQDDDGSYAIDNLGQVGDRSYHLMGQQTAASVGNTIQCELGARNQWIPLVIDLCRTGKVKGAERRDWIAGRLLGFITGCRKRICENQEGSQENDQDRRSNPFAGHSASFLSAATHQHPVAEMSQSSSQDLAYADSLSKVDA